MFKRPESIHTATPTMDATTLATANRINFIGQSVTAQRRVSLPGDAEWVIIGWEKGIPTHTKPISSEVLKTYLDRYSHHFS
jgi:hypothetical protein